MMAKRKQKQRKSESPESLATVMLGDMIPAATKRPSKILERKISACASNFKKLADSIKDALEQGRKEGFSDKEIGKMIKSKMLQAGFDRRTVLGYLPSTAKYKPRGRHVKNGLVREKNSQTDVTNNGEHTKGAEELEPQEEEQQQEQSQEIWQTRVEDYNIHEVERYDRLFLIELVHYLHDRLKKREARKQ